MSLVWMLVGSLIGVISSEIARSGHVAARSGDTPLRSRLRGVDEGVRAALHVLWCGLLGVAGFLGATAVIDASTSGMFGEGASRSPGSSSSCARGRDPYLPAAPAISTPPAAGWCAGRGIDALWDPSRGSPSRGSASGSPAGSPSASSAPASVLPPVTTAVSPGHGRSVCSSRRGPLCCRWWGARRFSSPAFPRASPSRSGATAASAHARCCSDPSTLEACCLTFSAVRSSSFRTTRRSSRTSDTPCDSRRRRGARRSGD